MSVDLQCEGALELELHPLDLATPSKAAMRTASASMLQVMRKAAVVKASPLRPLALALFLFLVRTSMAEPSFLETFTKFYRPAAGTALANAKCVTCHGPEGHLVKNFYGKRLMEPVENSDSGTVTPDILIEVEGEDSDGDGYTNLEEIVSGTLPGDPKSHPNAHPAHLPKRPPRHPLWKTIMLGVGALLIAGAIWLLAAKIRSRAT